jgi:hypothetical protein
MSLVDSIYNRGDQLARLPLDLTSAAFSRARGLELEVRRRALHAVDDAFLAAVDLALARVLADDVVDRALSQIEKTGVAQRVTQRLLDDGIAEQLAQKVLAGPDTERLLATALSGPLAEEAVAQLLANEALWVLVDEIARSPSVTQAIAHQSTGFFEEVAERARDRSRNADARLERIARRISLRRSRRDTGETPALPPVSEPPPR